MVWNGEGSSIRLAGACGMLVVGIEAAGPPLEVRLASMMLFE